MSYRSIKWIILTVLSLTAPAMLFLLMVVMFVPAIFFVAGAGYVVPKVFTPGHTGESLGFMAILGVHVLIYFGLYYGISALVAKAITLVKGRLMRNAIVVAICLGCVFLTQFSVYGGGGHRPIRWSPLPHVLGEVNQMYGTGTVGIVYGAAILLLIGILLFPKLKSKRR